MPGITKTLGIATACLLTLGCDNPTGKPQIERDLLLQSSNSRGGTPYTAYPQGAPELTLLKLKIPANTELNWHTHPMANAAYVLQGEISVEARDGGKVRLINAGQPLAEVVDIAHRGKTGRQPVELLVFYAGTPGLALSR